MSIVAVTDKLSLLRKNIDEFREGEWAVERRKMRARLGEYETFHLLAMAEVSTIL